MAVELGPEILGVMAITALFVIFLIQSPKIFKDFFDAIAKSSAECVAGDLAGLISISAAAPQDIMIKYNATIPKINYTVELDQRNIVVERLSKGKSTGESFTNIYAVDGLQIKIENNNEFIIQKTNTATGNVYVFRRG